jgi:hypothetical protein
MYRLMNGRFEQIGMSWLKHGFVSTNSTTAGCAGAGGQSCTPPPAGGNQLGVGCTDPYGSSLNGSRPLGMRSEVNSTNGAYPFPFTQLGSSGPYQQRIKVAESDLALSGALYFVEGQYVAPDDALAGNGLNNASYRSVNVAAAPNYTVSLAGSTVEAKSALWAWKAADATVEISNVEMCTAPVERFEVARKVTEVVSGTWHYEYAVRNMNSDHAGGAFEVQFPPETDIANAGARIVDHHSGEPYSTTPWTTTIEVDAGFIRWETAEPYATDPDANALRWATTFSFWFDADAPPASAAHVVEPFRPLGEAIADAGDDADICAGDSIQIGSPPIAGQTYLWSPGGQTTAQITVSPGSTTVYTLTATNGCVEDQDTVEVAVDPGPAAPGLIAPAHGADELVSPVTLEWSAAAGATSYSVKVATDASFANLVVDQETGTPGYEIASLAAGDYYWRVRSMGTCSGPNSSTFTFSVDNHLFNDDFESGDTSEWSSEGTE